LPKIRSSFESKVLSVKGREEYTPHEKYIAWARFWNQTLYDMYRNDYLSLTELERLSYEITEEAEEVSNLLSGNVTRGPKFYPKPSCSVAMDRLIEMANTLLIDSMPASTWRIGEMPITTSIIQVHNNDPIIYSEEDVSRVLNTGRSVLAQLIFTHPQEWENFLHRLKITDGEIQVLNNMINGKMIFPEFVKTEENGRTIEDLVLQVRLWASARLQTISRSIKGALARREAYCFLAKLQYPEYDDERIESLVSEKLQIIISFQTFNSVSLKEALSPANMGKITTLPKREEELHNALLYYSTPACLRTCGVEVSHVVNENGTIYAVLLSGDVLDEIHRTWLPGLPILCEESEGDYISCALGFARGEYIQSVPHHSDGFFEQEIKFPNLLVEFQNDPRIVTVGVKDKVCSHDYNTFGHLQALKEKEETAAQRVQNVYGTRIMRATSSSSGSSDVFSSRWVEGEGEGMGRASYISEEVYSSYATFLKSAKGDEKRSVSIEYLQEAMFKDVGLLPITRTITKSATGTAQQLYTRWTYWLNTSSRVSPQKKFHLAFFGVGNCYQSVLIKYSFVIFVLSAIVVFLQPARNVRRTHLSLFYFVSDPLLTYHTSGRGPR